MSTTLPCPRCRGAGIIGCLVDRRGADGEMEGGFEYLACPTCKGGCRITAEHAELLERGREHHDARVGRREGLRECADRYGCTPVQLSAYEHGQEPLPAGCRPDEV